MAAAPHSAAPFNTSVLAYDFATPYSVSAAPTRILTGLPTGHAPLYRSLSSAENTATRKTLTPSPHRGYHRDSIQRADAEEVPF